MPKRKNVEEPKGKKELEEEVEKLKAAEPKQEVKQERLELVKSFSKKVLEKYGKYVKCIVMMCSVARE